MHQVRLNSIILLSGGIDSTTSLIWALNNEYNCFALSFNYKQTHLIELEYAKEIAKKYNCIDHYIINLDFSLISDSALTGKGRIPRYKSTKDLPESYTPTYVQARNLIFLSYATALAEKLNVPNIIFGVNKEDKVNFPDCNKEFFYQFEKTANMGTTFIKKKNKLKIITPFIDFSKKQIVEYGKSNNIDYNETFSCYNPINNKPCGHCLSCIKRKEVL